MPHITKQEAKTNHIPSKTLQTIIFPKVLFTKESAKAWLRSHAYKHTHMRTTTDSYRFWQTPDIIGAEYYSIKLKNGVTLVWQNY